MRLIIEGGNPGERQMALDEAMLILASNNLVEETVRLWNFSPTTLTIGRFLAVRDWVNEEERKKLGIPLIRRFTGGGPALHDERGEVTWSVLMKGVDVMEAYRQIGSALVKAIGLLGLKAEFSPINDVTVMGKKVVGMAGAKKRDAVLVHGTFMFSTYLGYMKVIKSPEAKVKERGSPEGRVSNLSALLGSEISRREAVEALIEGFSSEFKLRDGELTELEVELSSQLKFKYTNERWTYLR
ncbi:MAG: lipoate--protein ligase family protein [Candidatus Aramenus sp.]|jgi:lipoate-protein ligase A|nr:lipoate--protein ligase family protein [Candidatus Aramenus sp.]